MASSQLLLEEVRLEVGVWTGGGVAVLVQPPDG
jgi:hypothetical protein